MKPHDCVVLGIDPGAKSGWAIVDRGELVASGVAMSSAQRLEVMNAVAEAREQRRLVVVAEAWTVGKGRGERGKRRGDRWNPTTMIGLGASWGRWQERFEEAGVLVRSIVRVTPAVWRKAMLTGLPRRTRDQAKASAARVASKYAKREVSLDEAEAICIALFGARAPQVDDVLEKLRNARPLRLVGEPAESWAWSPEVGDYISGFPSREAAARNARESLPPSIVFYTARFERGSYTPLDPKRHARRARSADA